MNLSIYVTINNQAFNHAKNLGKNPLKVKQEFFKAFYRGEWYFGNGIAYPLTFQNMNY